MSLETEQIKAGLSLFAGKYGPATILPATVTAMNADDTIAVEFSDASSVDDVRLKSIVAAGNKVILIPKVGSIVLVGSIENSDEYVVLAVHEIDEVQMLIDNVIYKVDANGFLFQKDNDTLKQVIQLIIEAVQAIIVMQGTNPDRAKLSQAMNKLNNLLQ